MNPREALWLAHPRRRWMLPDPSRWLQPDQRKWTGPESPRHAQSEPYERKYANVALHAENLARLERSIAAMRRELACVQAELLRRKAGFNPNQPRWPKGTSEGGQWSGGSGVV